MASAIPGTGPIAGVARGWPDPARRSPRSTRHTELPREISAPGAMKRPANVRRETRRRIGTTPQYQEQSQDAPATAIRRTCSGSTSRLAMTWRWKRTGSERAWTKRWSEGEDKPPGEAAQRRATFAETAATEWGSRAQSHSPAQSASRNSEYGRILTPSTVLGRGSMLTQR